MIWCGYASGVTSNSSDHYFTALPASAADLIERRVQLGSRDVSVVTAAGVFSPQRLDGGTSVLLRSVPTPPATGTFLDLGTGWGPIALTLGLESPDATVIGVDVNERALGLLAENARRLDLGNIHAATPDSVPADVEFDLIWSNPPIRVGKTILHDMLVKWLGRLAPGGVAYLVVQKNLGSDSLQKWLSEQWPEWPVSRLASAKGFRVIEVIRPQQ